MWSSSRAFGRTAPSIEATGARVVPLEAERRSLNPMAAGYAAGRLAAILKEIRPDIVHCVALRSVLVGGTACAMAGIDARVYALTGTGPAGSAPGPWSGASARAAIRLLLRGPLLSRGTRFLFENDDDPHLLGLDPADASPGDDRGRRRHRPGGVRAGSASRSTSSSPRSARRPHAVVQGDRRGGRGNPAGPRRRGFRRALALRSARSV